MTNLKFERMQRGLSLRALGLKLAYSQQPIWALENRKRQAADVSDALREALEKEFNQPLEWLLSEVELKAPTGYKVQNPKNRFECGS